MNWDRLMGLANLGIDSAQLLGLRQIRAQLVATHAQQQWNALAKHSVFEYRETLANIVSREDGSPFQALVALRFLESAWLQTGINTALLSELPDKEYLKRVVADHAEAINRNHARCLPAQKTMGTELRNVLEDYDSLESYVAAQDQLAAQRPKHKFFRLLCLSGSLMSGLSFIMFVLGLLFSIPWALLVSLILFLLGLPAVLVGAFYSASCSSLCALHRDLLRNVEQRFVNERCARDTYAFYKQFLTTLDKALADTASDPIASVEPQASLSLPIPPSPLEAAEDITCTNCGTTSPFAAFQVAADGCGSCPACHVRARFE